MDQDVERLQSDTFVVKVMGGDGADMVGHIQHVVTREKYRFRGVEELGSAITRMKRRDGGAEDRREGAT